MRWCGAWCWWISLACVAVLMFTTGAFFADREVPFERYDGWIVPAMPVPGDRVEVHWHGELRKVCEGKITRTLKDWDGDEFELQSSEARYMERGKLESMSSIMIPRAATCDENPEHKATYTAEARYYCNPTHRIWPLYTTKSISFNISCGESK